MAHVFSENDSAARSVVRGDWFYWRFIGTAIGFFAFGLGALLLSVAFPVLRLLPRPRCQQLSRSALQGVLRTYLALVSGLGTISYELHGVERLGRPGQLIIANHPTLIDALFLIAFTPQAVCVAKGALFRSFLIRNVIAATGYISNELTADMIESAATALRAGECLIMFPEATRTRVGEPLLFQRGAANIGVRAATQVTPVYITCHPITLTKAEPWYRIPPRRAHFTLRVGEDFSLAEYRANPSIPLGSRAFNELLQANFERELQRPHGYTSGSSTGNESELAG